MKKNPLVHPLLFALCFILTFYWANVGEVSPSEIVVPTAITLGATALLLALAWAVLRDPRKAGLSVSIFVVLFFSYGHVSSALLSLTHVAAIVINSGVFAVWGLSGLLSLYLVWRTPRDLSNLTILLNIVGAVLLVVPAASIAYQETRSHSRYAVDSTPSGITLSQPESLPDIYYIILDRYASATTLSGVYDFDNSEFIEYLQSEGFFVASDSHSNYLYTGASLASSLNMEYLDTVADNFTQWDQVYPMLQDYRVWRALKSAGYEFVHIGSWWDPTRVNRYADVNFNYAYAGGLSEFQATLLKTTALYLIWEMWHDKRKELWKGAQRQFDELDQLPKIREPTFVFAHLLATHPDYVFDENGNYLADPDGRSTREMYVNSIKYVNSRLRELIENLLSDSDSGVTPIIILQADEGPLPGGGDWNDWPEEPTDSDYREKSGILNAYYLPGTSSAALYPSVSSVNTFRILFNSYFMAGLDLLPDRTYSWKPGMRHDACDVTHRL